MNTARSLHRWFFARSVCIAAISSLGAVAQLSGCRSGASPYRTAAEGSRDTARAERLNREAADAMQEGNWSKAQDLLQRALAADLYLGPAHNNLGIVHMKQGNLYEASNEFEWARRLMPGHPDPRINLAMVLEQVGKPADAIASYRSALEVYPDHIGAIQGLVRLQLRQGTVASTNPDIRELLEQVALRGESDEWKEWARLHLARSSTAIDENKPSQHPARLVSALLPNAAPRVRPRENQEIPTE
jgi:Flp pilus assembly protein TadD